MPNYCPKDPDKMRKLASLGGFKSGEVRRKKKAAAILRARATAKGIELPPDPEPYKHPNLLGGSHDDDWRCPYCRHVNTIKRRSCAECCRTPANGRMTRAARRQRAAEHKTQAILRKHGL